MILVLKIIILTNENATHNYTLLDKHFTVLTLILRPAYEVELLLETIRLSRAKVSKSKTIV